MVGIMILAMPTTGARDRSLQVSNIETQAQKNVRAPVEAGHNVKQYNRDRGQKKDITTTLCTRQQCRELPQHVIKDCPNARFNRQKGGGGKEEAEKAVGVDRTGSPGRSHG